MSSANLDVHKLTLRLGNSSWRSMEWTPKLRQRINAHRRKKENVIHGVVSAEVHSGIQESRSAAAGAWGGGREVSRGCEMNANVLHRWRREMRDSHRHCALRDLRWFGNAVVT